jgi:hypothetical protein
MTPVSAPSLHLDRLCSLEDRQALEALVVGVLSPPADFPRLYSRLRQEEVGKPSGDGFTDALSSHGLTGRADERLARDTAQAYLAWTGGGLRQYFLAQSQSMLEWAARLHLKDGSPVWSPRAWVETAEALEAAPDLLCLVIEKAPTAAWPTWRSAFGLERYWSQAWSTWEGCFFRSPALALRWLDELLAARPKDASDGHALENLRARLSVALEVGSDHAGLLAQLDQRLAAEGAMVHLEAVDWSFVLFDGQKPKTPAAVREAFLAFLRKNEQATRRWLELSVSSPNSVSNTLNPRSTLRHARVALAVMAHHGQATVQQFRGVLALVARSEKSPLVREWLAAVDSVLVKEWGQKLADEKPKPKKKKSANRAKLVAPAPVSDVKPSPAKTPVTEEIPRFAPR